MIEAPSRQQLRTQETQARLLDAAEEVFVREGYEAAQLDTIAATAGRSKGAVYTHFKSKEDLFLALFEHRTRSYIERLMTTMKTCKGRKQSLKAFRAFYVGLAQDRAWSILTLEFKLFALRHAESKVRLRKAFKLSKTGNDEKIYEQMFGQLSETEKAENDKSLLALGPIVSGLVLESHFEPEAFSKEALENILGRIFDAIVSGSASTRARG